MKKSTIAILFFVGLGIVLFPHVSKFSYTYIQKAQAEEFQDAKMAPEAIDQVYQKALTCNEEILKDTDGFRDPFNQEESQVEKFRQCFDLMDGEIFAVIEIPKLELIIPIYLGASDEILDKGIGQVEGSSLPVGGLGTHSVLAGHRGMATRLMFRDLDQVVPGDIFLIHTLKETLTYTVTSQEIIYPYETESLEIVEGKDLVTLITCHPYRHNYQRLLIHGERSS